MAEYGFRLQFELSQGSRIESDLEELELFRTSGGQRVRLRSGARGTPIKDHSEVAIVGGPFPSLDEAHKSGDHARAALLIWALRRRIGLDLGDSKLRGHLTDAGQKYFAEELGRPVRESRPGLDVHEWREGLVFMSLRGKGTLSVGAKGFSDALRAISTMAIALTEKQLVAAELYCASFFDGAFRSRFITLVTAVEALLDPASRPTDVQSLIDDCTVKLKKLQLDSQAQQALRSGLERLRSDSIGQSGRALAERLLGEQEYDGKAAGRFFAYCYRIRSEILHNGSPSDSTIDLLDMSNSCSRFVADLLLAAIGS